MAGRPSDAPDLQRQQASLAARRGRGGSARIDSSEAPPPASTTASRGSSTIPARSRASALAGRGRSSSRSVGYTVVELEGRSSVRTSPVREEAQSDVPASGNATPMVPSSVQPEQSDSHPQESHPQISTPQVSQRDHLHPQWYIRCIMYLVAFLHTKHRVTFRGAGLILVCLGFIFSCLMGNFSDAVALPRTLKTVFSRFDINDHFTVHPICFQCHHVFEPDIDPDTFCSDCEEEVFGARASENIDSEPDGAGDGPRLGKRRPNLVSPIQLLSTGLQDFFKRPGMVSAVNCWRSRTQVEGELNCMQDGRVWNEMKDKDGNSFFHGPHADEEIRLGVSFSLDWFNRSKSSFAPSQSSGAMSFCVQNLTNSLRYRSENLIFSGGTGQKEPTAEQLQHYLKIIVDDLIMLYEDGIVVNTPEFPNGKRVRVALVLIIADHPAMCKLCGFADHSHDGTPCTKCEVTHEELFTQESLLNEFQRRTGAEHRRLAYMYKNLATVEEKELFFSEHGVRWTEFARLYYFDLVRCTVIDPMHNLLLGVAKNQWFSRWIETGALRARELNIIHEFLESFEAPF